MLIVLLVVLILSTAVVVVANHLLVANGQQIFVDNGSLKRNKTVVVNDC